MLTKKSSYGFRPRANYPTYEYVSKKDTRRQANCDGSRMIPPPRGYREVIRLQDVEAHFKEYLEWLKEDHKDLTDAQLLEHPNGNFIGAWRNARWIDEIERRGI